MFRSVGNGLAVDNFSGPLKMQIKSIAVIDLAAAHTFSSNSPCITIACGKFTTQTEVLFTILTSLIYLQ